MTVRPFDWRDIPALHRNQPDSIFLDSTLLLTRGPQQMFSTLFSYLAPAIGLSTAVVERSENGTSSDGSPLIGQIMHVTGSPFAHLTFITPAAALTQVAAAALTEYLVTISGKRGALRLLADVEEQNEAFDILHQSGFAIYARQRIWQITGPQQKTSWQAAWRAARQSDAFAIRLLYNSLVPGMVQQVEPFVTHHPGGMVYYQDGELRAYVELKYGLRGIWAQPFIHPDAEDVPQRFIALLQKIPNRRSRPVYVCIRSYQAWLEAAIEELGAEAGPRQAVIVKHLAIQQKAARILTLPALEGGQAEISAPIVRVKKV